jgi:drug/metabolite transporter (DMT)-like permease
LGKNKNNRLIGIILFSLAISLASIQAGIAKYLTTTLPIAEIVWARYFGFFIISGTFALFKYRVVDLLPKKILHQFIRSILMILSTFFFTTATSVMPLANATAIIFAYPFLVALAAPTILGEKVHYSSWIAVSFGFLGVLLIIRPGLEDFTWYSILALNAGLCFGIHLLVTRKLTADIDPLLLALFTAFLGTTIATLPLPFIWQTPSLKDVILLGMVAFISTASQILTIIACAKTEMAVLAPFGYVELLSGVLIGFAIFGHLPDIISWFGMSAILLSGIYIAIFGKKVTEISRTRPSAH